MICKTCGNRNSETNKYCIDCGEELIPADNDIHNICNKCGAENEPENKYCTFCGYKLKENNNQEKSVQQTHSSNKIKKDKLHNQANNPEKFINQKKFQRKKDSKNIRSQGIQKSLGLKAIWIIGGLLIGFVIFKTTFDLIISSKKKEIPVELKSSNPVVEASVFEIASKFVCSCGTCGEQSLEICKCVRAVEERQFIRDYLEQNQKPDDIVIAIANKYGWIKAEFASKYKVDASRIWNPNQLQITKEITSTLPGLVDAKASISDKYTIYSAFNCPCGKCGIDELKDCTCNHPNGALEVKKFIDENINENKYTINEIIGFVDKKYGGKKI